MVISYYGLGFVKIASGETVVVFDPKGARFSSNLALSSGGKSDYTHANFLIEGPGEYEHGGLYARGVGVANKSGKPNTIYIVTIEGVTVCHLGELDQGTLSPDVIESIGEIDILFLPVGKEALSPSVASKLSSELGPALVIPMGDVKSFLKEEGEEGVGFQDKLTLRRKDLEGKEGEIMALKQL